jgi:sugar-specific transcriptional regulator TrmB
MQHQEVLTKIGLTEKEAGLYASLIESGPATVSVISKNTGLHRPIVYKVLPGLQEKGLVTVSPKGKLRYYVAESPEKLQLLLDAVADTLKNDAIPELKGLFQSFSRRPTVKVLEGQKGVTFVFEDLLASLKTGETYYRYSSVRESLYDTNKYLPVNYKERRERKKIERLVITSEAVRKRLEPSLDREEKIVPAKYDLFDDNITQLIYADKVAFIDYNSETALIIENPILANFQKKLFKLLYGKL